MSITLELPLELASRLETLSQNTGESPENCLIDALERLLEDTEDYADAVRISKQIRRGEMEVYSSEEVAAYLDLEN